MTSETLADYGWNSFFASQLDPFETLLPARVAEVHRGRLQVVGPGLTTATTPFSEPGDDEKTATVGDWLMLDPVTARPRQLLARRSLFKRRAPGTGRDLQLIAANVDTLFIVSSCNQDFSTARLERYLALAQEAEVMPVVVLTKPDLPDPPLSGEASQRNWLVKVDFVCHDIKFGATADSVFAWPEKPTETVLDKMVAVVVSDALAMRGDGPSYLDYTDIIAVSIEETAMKPGRSNS